MFSVCATASVAPLGPPSSAATGDPDLLSLSPDRDRAARPSAGASADLAAERTLRLGRPPLAPSLSPSSILDLALATVDVMPALESRYDHDSSTASSHAEDFVNASPSSAARAAAHRPSSAAGSARSQRSSRSNKVHSSSSSESTDSEEERALREELDDARGDIEAGVVRGQPVEGRVERIMRSVGKGSTGGASQRSSQRYNALGHDDDELARRHHKKKHAHAKKGSRSASATRSSSARRSGRRSLNALGKDDPASSTAPNPYAVEGLGDDPLSDVEKGAVTRSSSKRSLRSSASSKKAGEKGGDGGAGDPGSGAGAAKGKPRRRVWWCYAFIALIVVIVVALGVFIAVRVAQDKKETAKAESESSVAADHEDGESAVESGSSTAATDAAHASTALADSTLDAHAETTSAPVNDGQYHPSSAAAATSAPAGEPSDAAAASVQNDGKYTPTTAATLPSSAPSQMGEFGSDDPQALPSSAAADAQSGAPSAGATSSPDSHAQSATDSPAASADSSPKTSATSSGAADVFAQTTMPAGVSMPSSAAPSILPAADGQQQHDQQQHESAAAPLSSIQLGPGPVVVSTPLGDPVAAASATSSPVVEGAPQQTGAAQDGAWHAEGPASQGEAGAAAPSATTAAPGLGSGEWQGAPSASPSPSPAAGSWNPDGVDGAAAAAAGPFAVASVYKATQPEAFQTLKGNGTYFEASQHYGPCGVAANKTDFVVALSNAMWLNSTQGSTTTPSSFCGAELLVTNLANGLSIKAWATERCALCVGNASLDLSVPVFSALSGDNLDLGVIDIIWGWTGNSSAAAVAPSAAAAVDSAAPSASSSSTDDGWLWRRAEPTRSA